MTIGLDLVPDHDDDPTVVGAGTADARHRRHLRRGRGPERVGPRLAGIATPTREFWLGWALFVVFFMMPAISGYFLGQGYTALEDGDTTATIGWAAAIAVSELVRMVAIHHGALIWTKAWIHMQTLLRANMLSAQMASGGLHAGQPVGSAGSAVTHFRDDTEDVANLVDGMVDISGGVVFTVIAGFVLGAADARAAAVLIIPLLGVGVATRVLDTRIKEYRAADRTATGA